MPSSDQEIEADVERILARFAEELEDVEVEDGFFIERDRSTRDPKARDAPEGFRDRMLSNAPKSDGERLYAEKRSW